MSNNGAPCKILVVDDHKDQADTAAMLLRLHGHEARTAYSPKEALAKVAEQPPDVILMDVGLPGKNGFDLGKEIRRSHPAVRIVVVTGFGQEELVRASKEAGFSGHLLKPVDPAVMNAVVNEQCTAASKKCSHTPKRVC
jgi:CheY-like chemotaxis protein